MGYGSRFRLGLRLQVNHEDWCLHVSPEILQLRSERYYNGLTREVLPEPEILENWPGEHSRDLELNITVCGCQVDDVPYSDPEPGR